MARVKINLLGASILIGIYSVIMVLSLSAAAAPFVWGNNTSASKLVSETASEEMMLGLAALFFGVTAFSYYSMKSLMGEKHEEI